MSPGPGAIVTGSTGSREHEELWVPAEELAEFNGQGPMVVIAAFFGDGFTGEVPAQAR